MQKNSNVLNSSWVELSLGPDSTQLNSFFTLGVGIYLQLSPKVSCEFLLYTTHPESSHHSPDYYYIPKSRIAFRWKKTPKAKAEKLLSACHPAESFLLVYTVHSKNYIFSFFFLHQIVHVSPCLWIRSHVLTFLFLAAFSLSLSLSFFLSLVSTQ